MHDLLIRNGIVIDPAEDVNGVRDIAITGGRISAVESTGTDLAAYRTIDANGLYVVPGLIDFHVHVFPGVSHFGVDPDSTCLARGVTTVLDFGTSGNLAFDGFRRFVIDSAKTRVFALVHIAAQGLISSPGIIPTLGELHDLRYCDVDAVEQCVERHHDCIVGIKIRLTDNLAEDGRNEAAALQLARQAADRVNLPLVIHCPNSTLTIEHILSQMKAGDVLTHCFHDKRCGLVDESLRVLPIVREKLEEGVLLDIGHGWGSFAFRVARAMLDQGVEPHFISSDIHTYNLNGPVFDLLTTLDKFLHLGMELPEVIRRATQTPAAFLGHHESIGTLKSGTIADVTILDLTRGEFPLIDSEGVTEVGTQRLDLKHVLRAGVPTGILPRPEALPCRR